MIEKTRHHIPIIIPTYTDIIPIAKEQQQTDVLHETYERMRDKFATTQRDNAAIWRRLEDNNSYSFTYANDQLVALLAETVLRTDGLQQHYDAITTTFGRTIRNSNLLLENAISDTTFVKETTFQATDQLLFAYLAAHIGRTNPEHAYVQLQEIYASDNPLYWNEFSSYNNRNEKIDAEGIPFRSSTALTRILLLSQYNIPQAKEEYRLLQASPLFDSVTQCFLLTYPDSPSWPYELTSANQLLSVFVEATLGLPTAEEHYTRLKTSSLYDPLRKSWREKKSMQHADTHGKPIETMLVLTTPLDAQLLDLVVQKTISMEEIIQPVALPSLRAF